MTQKAKGKDPHLQEIEDEWHRLLEVAQRVPEDAQLHPAAIGHWSVKDMLGHITTWDDEMVRWVKQFCSSGEKHGYGGEADVDRLNQAEAEKKRALSLDQVWDELHQSHQRLLDFLRGLPDEAFTPGTYTGEQIAVDGAEHYREHREDLERWRASRG